MDITLINFMHIRTSITLSFTLGHDPILERLTILINNTICGMLYRKGNLPTFAAAMPHKAGSSNINSLKRYYYEKMDL